MTAKANDEPDIDAVKKLVTAGYMDAVHSNDPARYASLFTEDGMWMPPESQPVSGRDAIEEAERHIFSAVSLKIACSVIEANVSGDVGWALGEIDGTKVPHNGSDTTPFFFRLMWVVRKEEGAWKIHRQIWNSRPTGKGIQYQL